MVEDPFGEEGRGMRGRESQHKDTKKGKEKSTKRGLKAKDGGTKAVILSASRARRISA